MQNCIKRMRTEGNWRNGNKAGQNSRNVHDLIKEEMDLNAEHTSNTDFCAFSDDAKWH